MDGRPATVFVLGAIGLTLAGLALLLAPPAGAQTLSPDADLKLNQIQLVGTGESYKQAVPSGLLTLIRLSGKKNEEKLDFAEPPLDAQLDAGARALSFDIAYDPKGGLYKNPAMAAMADDLLDKDYTGAMATPGFKVIHVLDVDYRSSCLTLKACLAQVADWSRAHPDHLPILVSLSSNDEKTPMPGAVTPAAWDGAALAALDQEVATAFPAGMLITPDTVKGAHASLREAVLDGGWPSLAQARGKVMVLFNDTPQKVALYDGGHLFVTAGESSPNAGVVFVDDPRRQAAHIQADVKAGFVVVTRADEETQEARANDPSRRDAAFGSGAQFVLTDFLMPDHRIGPYQVGIADSRHAKCDAVNADCSAWNGAFERTATAR